MTDFRNRHFKTTAADMYGQVYFFLLSVTGFGVKRFGRYENKLGKDLASLQRKPNVKRGIRDM